jgi:futalosine hydrolase
MKILIIAATGKEIEPFLKTMKVEEPELFDSADFKYKKLKITVILTGVGMVVTAMDTVAILSEKTFDVALNVGLCGSFNRNLEIGTVVNVYKDTFSEMGAEDGDDFLSVSKLKLDAVTTIENVNLSEGITNFQIELLPKVNGITVNTVHGNEKSIEKVVKRFHPIVESMEGAAFMLACKGEAMPYAQIRAVSNFVERRNKDNWNIPLAIENLNNKMLEILDAF